MTLSDKRVAIENSACQSEFDWKLVGIVVYTPDGLMFCNQARQVLFWLPKRLFEGNSLREQVLDLATRNGVTIRRLS